MKKLTAAIVTSLLALGFTSRAHAQPAGQTPPEPVAPALPPATDPLSQPPAQPPPGAPPPSAPEEPYAPSPRYDAQAPPPRATRARESEDAPEEMSEGRRIVVAYNTGFQWGLSPGVIVGNSKASFFLGLRLGYGFDTGKVIVVPGVRLSGFFSDPNVYIGMPVMKLVYPIDRFAPFVEAGAGYGYISGFSVGKTDVPAESGVALFAGTGFMIHFSWKFGLGVEGTYQTITGTEFSGFGIGPIIALAF